MNPELPLPPTPPSEVIKIDHPFPWWLKVVNNIVKSAHKNTDPNDGGMIIPEWYAAGVLADWTTDTPTNLGSYFLCRNYDTETVRVVTITKIDGKKIIEAENMFPSWRLGTTPGITWLWYGPLTHPPIPIKPPMSMEDAVALIKSYSDDKRYLEAVDTVFGVATETTTP
jgi:hypothetical protein